MSRTILNGSAVPFVMNSRASVSGPRGRRHLAAEEL